MTVISMKCSLVPLLPRRLTLAVLLPLLVSFVVTGCESNPEPESSAQPPTPAPAETTRSMAARESDLQQPKKPTSKQARGGDTPAIKLGQMAPDFELPPLTFEDGKDGKKVARIGIEKIRLSSFRGKKPVFLIFSSYT